MSSISVEPILYISRRQSLAISLLSTHPLIISVTFYGDLVISKACRENKILLWKITGFSSSKPLPPRTSAPTIQGHSETRSAFSDCSAGGGFQVLLTFGLTAADPFWMRFGLFHQPSSHPMLAMGNMKGRISFWDLKLLEDGVVDKIKDGVGSAGAGPRGRGKGKARITARDESVDSASSTAADANGLRGPFARLAPHKIVIAEPGNAFSTRQSAWSLGGEWCVVVGNAGTISVLRRWEQAATT